MTVWVVICEESQKALAARARRERRIPRQADFFGLVRFGHAYLFGAQGTSMRDLALLRGCARFSSRAEAKEALGSNGNDDGYLYHFVELTADHVALLDLAEVE